MENQTNKKQPDIEKVMSALKTAGVVIPPDFGLPGRVIAEMSKRGIEVGPDTGGLVLSHYVLVWRD